MKRSRVDPVRIGVVGLGGFGRLHALCCAGIAEAEPVALVARRKQSLDAIRGELPDVPGWLDLGKALRESGAEAWVVASTTSTHVSLTRQILEAGCPVLVEKPLSESLEEALSLEPLVRPDSRNVMLGHILLFNTEFRQLAREVSSRGPLVHIACVRHRPSASLELYPGESPFHLSMVHDLYSVLALVGRREPVSFSSRVHRTRSGAVDLALAHVGWEDGLLASFAASFLTPPGLPQDGYDQMEVFGEGWAARVNANPRPLTLWDDRARSPLTLEILADPLLPSGMLAEELRTFCRVVRGETPVPVGATYGDALQVMRWLDRLEHSGGETC